MTQFRRQALMYLCGTGIVAACSAVPLAHGLTFKAGHHTYAEDVARIARLWNKKIYTKDPEFNPDQGSSDAQLAAMRLTNGPEVVEKDFTPSAAELSFTDPQHLARWRKRKDKVWKDESHCAKRVKQLQSTGKKKNMDLLRKAVAKVFVVKESTDGRGHIVTSRVPGKDMYKVFVEYQELTRKFRGLNRSLSVPARGNVGHMAGMTEKQIHGSERKRAAQLENYIAHAASAEGLSQVAETMKKLFDSDLVLADNRWANFVFNPATERFVRVDLTGVDIRIPNGEIVDGKWWYLKALELNGKSAPECQATTYREYGEQIKAKGRTEFSRETLDNILGLQWAVMALQANNLGQEVPAVLAAKGGQDYIREIANISSGANAEVVKIALAAMGLKGVRQMGLSKVVKKLSSDSGKNSVHKASVKQLETALERNLEMTRRRFRYEMKCDKKLRKRSRAALTRRPAVSSSPRASATRTPSPLKASSPGASPTGTTAQPRLMFQPVASSSSRTSPKGSLPTSPKGLSGASPTGAPPRPRLMFQPVASSSSRTSPKESPRTSPKGLSGASPTGAPPRPRLMFQPVASSSSRTSPKESPRTSPKGLSGASAKELPGASASVPPRPTLASVPQRPTLKLF